jgi:Tfp pilus assembly protein PilF
MKKLQGATTRALGPIFGVLLVVVASYLPTLRGEFILDDKPLIRNNRFLMQSHPISSYIAQEDGITADSGYSHTGYYRPLINVTYRIDARLWGMRSAGFRATNLLLHLLTCLLFYQTVVLLNRDRKTALLLTLLFAIHPANTESVSWVTSRNNIVVTFFALASFYSYVTGWRKKSISALAVSVLAFAGAVFSKEFGLILPAMIFLYHRLIVRQKNHWGLEAWSYLPFVFVTLVYFMLRKTVTGSILSPADSGDLWMRLYFAPYLLLFNLRLVFFPFGLHSFIVGYPRIYPHLMAFGGFGGLGLIGLALWKARENRVFVFGVLSFLLALAPVLNIVNTSAISLISMRWLYFPTAFLLIGLSPMVRKLIDMSRFVTVTCLISLAVYFGAYTFILNRDLWYNEEKFFTHEVSHYNNLFYAGGLAELYYRSGKTPEAERWFKLSLERNPNDVRDHINYAALLIDTGRPQEAIKWLNNASNLTMVHRDRAEWHNNLGMAELALEGYEEALKGFRKAVIYDPDEPLFWSNLGGAYGSRGDYRNSVASFKRGLNIAEDSVLLRKNLANTYIKMEAYGAAVSVLEEIPALERQKDAAVMRLLTLASSKRKGGSNPGRWSTPLEANAGFGLTP